MLAVVIVLMSVILSVVVDDSLLSIVKLASGMGLIIDDSLLSIVKLASGMELIVDDSLLSIVKLASGVGLIVDILSSELILFSLIGFVISISVESMFGSETLSVGAAVIDVLIFVAENEVVAMRIVVGTKGIKDVLLRILK